VISEHTQDVVRHLTQMALRAGGGPLTDGQLLERYVSHGDEVAFEALVRRYGPMVLGVCRRILGQQADAEDAFQATFLVLVRKARSVTRGEQVGNWLYGVACRTARKAKALDARRRAKESEVGTARAQAQAGRDAQQRGRPAHTHEGPAERLQEALDLELEHLPEHYRTVLVLCELHGMTRKEAAAQLDCAEGTVASRLARGRELLAQRMARHGLALAGGSLTALLAQSASASIPASLVTTTLQAASAYAAGSVAAGVVSMQVLALSEGVLKAMLLTKLKSVLVVVVLVGAVGFGVGVARYQSAASAQAPADPYDKRFLAQDRPLPQGKTPAAPAKDNLDTVLPVLLEALKSSDVNLRRAAVEALAKLGTDRKDVQQALQMAAKDGDKLVRDVAANLLKRLTDTVDEKEAQRQQALANLRAAEAALAQAEARVAAEKDAAEVARQEALRERDRARAAEQKAGRGGEKVAFSPDGKRLAILRHGSADIVDANSGKLVSQFQLPKEARDATFSPDGRLLVIISTDGTVTALDSPTGKIVWRLDGRH
jgi:RNA polymerase sigma factor (sigma-70 family)